MTTGSNQEVHLADEEVELKGGGQSSGIVRVGNTVRRPVHENAEFVHALLEHLEKVGFDGAPRFLGIDDWGRETLSYIDGQVFAGPEDDGDPVVILSDAQLSSAARLIRRFHDATAGTPLTGDEEVVCHPDLGQHNIVFRGDEAVAIIDWDEDVRPGPRLLDFSHAVWCLAEIGEQGGDVADQGRRVRLLCDSYGWADSGVVIDEIEARFRRAIASHERHGRAEARRIFCKMLDWIVANGPELKCRSTRVA
jgi:hypothetical protein